MQHIDKRNLSNTGRVYIYIYIYTFILGPLIAAIAVQQLFFNSEAVSSQQAICILLYVLCIMAATPWPMRPTCMCVVIQAQKLAATFAPESTPSTTWMHVNTIPVRGCIRLHSEEWLQPVSSQLRPSTLLCEMHHLFLPPAHFLESLKINQFLSLLSTTSIALDQVLARIVQRKYIQQLCHRELLLRSTAG